MAGEDCVLWVSLRDHAGNTEFVRRTMGSLTRRIAPAGVYSSTSGAWQLVGAAIEHTHCLEYNFNFSFDVNLNVRKSEAFRSR